MLETLADKYNRLPEIIRWILCWPGFIIPSIVVFYIAPFFLGHWQDDNAISSDGSPNSLAGLFQVIITISAGFYCFYGLILYLVPRGQDIIAAIFTIFFVVVAIIGIVYCLHEFVQEQLGLFKTIGMTAQSIFIVVASITGAYIVRQAVMKNTRIIDKV